MAEVTGPISTLPGRGHDVPDGQTCDEHPDRLAIARIQGETDSFGAELIDMCEECLAEYREEVKTDDHSGICDWCRTHKPRLWNRRDDEEGMYGPVYLVCDDCSQRREERLREEMARYEPMDDYDPRWDREDW